MTLNEYKVLPDEEKLFNVWEYGVFLNIVENR